MSITQSSLKIYWGGERQSEEIGQQFITLKETLMFLALIQIPAQETIKQNLSDRYRMHQWLFQNHFSYCTSREFLFKVKKFDKETGLSILTLSKDAPLEGPFLAKQREVDVSLYKSGTYKVHVQVNPTVKRQGKVYGVNTPEGVCEWLVRKGADNGYQVKEGTVQVASLHKTLYRRGDNLCTVSNATLTALLVVKDEAKFQEMLINGLGRSKAVGFGLVEAQLV